MALFRWSENQIFQLIDFYRDHAVLWDTNNINYKNKKLKDSLILDFNDTTTQERSAEVTRHSMFDINDFEDTEETQKELCHTETLPQLKRHTSNTTTSNKKQKHDHIYTAATATL
ncbi:uncharacterized protein LOC118184541 [Stegodyphus dumicola]|uniref:uncharacterized protein LOC118184541 n=1 Tax=Stegodyphus dumicola TaxID=202533 RepID=UPI0015B17C02|nr:uncharacterized protein LOC118184541 [Stegodyphus dumicola]